MVYKCDELKDQYFLYIIFFLYLSTLVMWPYILAHCFGFVDIGLLEHEAHVCKRGPRMPWFKQSLTL